MIFMIRVWIFWILGKRKGKERAFRDIYLVFGHDIMAGKQSSSRFARMFVFVHSENREIERVPPCSGDFLVIMTGAKKEIVF